VKLRDFCAAAALSKAAGGLKLSKLLRFGKDKGNVVALVAPGIEVDGCKENAVRGVKHDAAFGEMWETPKRGENCVCWNTSGRWGSRFALR